jgi:hypothetical protein
MTVVQKSDDIASSDDADGRAVVVVTSDRQLVDIRCQRRGKRGK